MYINVKKILESGSEIHYYRSNPTQVNFKLFSKICNCSISKAVEWKGIVILTMVIAHGD